MLYKRKTMETKIVYYVLMGYKNTFKNEIVKLRVKLKMFIYN